VRAASSEPGAVRRIVSGSRAVVLLCQPIHSAIRSPKTSTCRKSGQGRTCRRLQPVSTKFFFPLDDTALAASCPHRPSASASLPRRWPSSPSRRPSLHLATPHPRFRALVPARSDSVLSFNRVGREGRGSRRPCTGRSHGGVFRGQECSQRPTEEK